MKNDKKYTGVAAVFWITTALALLVVFLIKQDDIIGVLKETAFFEHVFGSEPEFVARYEMPDKDRKGNTDEQPLPGQNEVVDITGGNSLKTDQSGANGTGGTSTTGGANGLSVQEIPSGKSGTADSPVSDALSGEKKVPAPKSEDKNKKTQTPVRTDRTDKKTDAPASKTANGTQSVAKMNQYLCFIVINGDGIVERKEVNRAVPKNDLPLTSALNALLEGPGISELEKGYISLIPSGTKLLSASVSNGTASVNFSQEFAFNKYGVEGYLGQLMQVVYTATAFGTIDNVQFLIEGQKSEYLGGEGVWIGTPLNRANFK